MKIIGGVLLLAFVVLVDHGVRTHKPTPKQFSKMVELEDCASTYLDDGLMGRA
jgi:hypothetical protein